ncbi:hypothetical protein CDD83_3696 [Cordyceps sp. RAO-2017]|nr:hypothetical protein CDD83_3696 [Cordyceps sp. RAO-2017]
MGCCCSSTFNGFQDMAPRPVDPQASPGSSAGDEPGPPRRTTSAAAPLLGSEHAESAPRAIAQPGRRPVPTPSTRSSSWRASFAEPASSGSGSTTSLWAAVGQRRAEEAHAGRAQDGGTQARGST